MNGAEWTACAFRLGGEQVGLSIERLDTADLERTAALLAWMVLQSAANGDAGQAGIRDAVYGQLSQHIAFQLPEERLPHLAPAWWGRAMERALVEFVRANGLGPRIRHHVQLLNACDARALARS